MIYTERTELKKHIQNSVNMNRALRFLEETDLAGLQPGVTDIAGEEVFVNRMSYRTQNACEGFFEAHQQYIDIHMLLAGAERIYVSGTEYLTRTGTAVDAVLYKGKEEHIYDMEPQKVLVVFPEEAHMVKVKADTACEVDKIVIKVKTD